MKETEIPYSPRHVLRRRVANLDCRLTTTHDAGDHFIFVGEVVDLRLFDGEPLMFHDRGYRGLTP